MFFSPENLTCFCLYLYCCGNWEKDWVSSCSTLSASCRHPTPSLSYTQPIPQNLPAYSNPRRGTTACPFFFCLKTKYPKEIQTFCMFWVGAKTCLASRLAQDASSCKHKTEIKVDQTMSMLIFSSQTVSL